MIDTSALLASRPVDIPAAQIQAQSLANLGNTNTLQQGAIAMQPGQLEGQSLQNQQTQMQIAQTQKVNDAYAQALTPGTPAVAGVNGAPGTPATPASFDSDKLQNALATHGAGSAIPSVMKGIMENQTAAATLATAKNKLASDQADYGGGIGKTVKDAGYSPQLLITQAQQGMSSGAITPGMAQPIIAELTQSLQADPTGAQAKALAQQLADHLISASPAQQKIIAEQQTSQSKADAVTNTKAKDAAELPGIVATGDQKQMQNVSSILAGAKTQADYAALLGEVPQKFAQRFVPAAQWTPASKADILSAGMTPDQQVTSTQTAANAAQTALRDRQNANNQALERQQENARIGIEQRNQTYAQQGGGSISDPEYMRGVVSGEIQVNPRDKNFAQTMAAAKAIDPTFTSDRYANRAATTHDFVAGTNAKRVQSFNQVMSHVGELQAASDNLGTNLAQYGPNWLGKAISNDVVRYRDATDTAGAELATMFAQGQATQGEVERTTDNLKSANPKTRAAGLDEYVHLVGGRMKGVAQTYSSGTGDKFPVLQYIDPDAVAVAQAHGVDLQGIANQQAPAWMKSKSGGPIQQAGTSAPAAPAAAVPATPHGIPDLGSTFNGHKVLKVEKVN